MAAAKVNMMVTGIAKSNGRERKHGQRGDVLQVQVWLSMNTEVFFFVELKKEEEIKRKTGLPWWRSG